MNAIEKETPSQDPMEPKAFYEKPMVTTFGTVAKLTMTGGTEQLKDSSMPSRKRGGG